MDHTKHGKLASAVGIALNLALAAAKIVWGALFGLISVLADGVNNLSDCGSGVVSLISFRIAAKPADKEHPYGHRRAEYVASMIIGFFVLLCAAELLRGSVEKILSGEPTVGTWGSYLLLGISIAVKGAMCVFYRHSAKKLESDVLKAASADSFCDCLASLAVAAGLLVAQFAQFPADGYAGLVVALFIVWEGVGIAREAGSKLLGRAPDRGLTEAIRAEILGIEGVLGMHDLRIYGYGPHTYFATAHIEMDAAVPSLEAHGVLDGLERLIAEKYGVALTAHLDPVDLNDAEAKELEERIRAAVEGMVEEMNLHDFRLVRGAVKKVLFELAVPFACEKSDAEIENDVVRAVRLLGDYEPIVTVERE